MLNPFRRSVRIPRQLGACLVTGTEKIRCGYGNGDCLLLAFRHGVFAVADATERFPQASRLLLERLAAEISESGPPVNGQAFESLLNRIWSQQQFIHKTTLSCVVLREDEDGPTAMLANNGDSSITILDAASGTTLFRTAADMNFAGRSRQPNPVATLRLQPPGATIVLATDGLADIGEIRETDVVQRPDGLTQWIGIRTRNGSEPPEIDDIGAIALTAGMPAMEYATIIMGGTRPGTETDFTRSAGRKPPMDRWEPISFWQRSPELMDLAGIRVR